MTLTDVLDLVALLLVLFGALLCLTASIGLLRWRDVPTRLHAATKPQILGLLVICIAVALALRAWPVIAFLVPTLIVQFATAPLGAHMVGRAAYRNGTIDEGSLVVDDLRDAREAGEAPAGLD